MKFAIVGAGAVGAYLGARMARAGIDVVLFGRGPHRAAIEVEGVRVRSPEGDFTARPAVAARLEEIGAADAVILGVKAHSLAELAPRLAPLLGPETVVISTQNGIPWWFFRSFGGEWEGLRLESVDPGGAVSEAIETRRIVGAIVYFSTEIVAPGVVRHIEGNRVSLGEPDGSRSDRCRRVAETLIASGLRAPVTARLRHEIWVKLLGNVAFNPISALTGATLAAMARDPDVSALVRRVMEEVEEVARRLGFELPVSIDQRIAGAEKVGEHKTSMLQDLEAGRPLELEAVAGSVLEIADRLGVPMPHTRAVYGCAKLRAAARGAR